jgi:hypothetical protein
MPLSSQDSSEAPQSPKNLGRWLELASEWGFSDFLSPEDGFRNCLHDQQRWARSKEPGIYFWLAEDGEAYVGQSIEPQSRLRQHWRNHRDIVQACFLPCDAQELDEVEERFVARAGEHFPLRNIKLAVATAREVPFDAVVSEEERERFLAGGMPEDEPLRPFEHLMRVQERRFAKFLARPDSASALQALQRFITLVIPQPAATEVGFWSATLFPKTGFIRLNVGQQEVFTFGGPAGDGVVRIFSDKRLSYLHSAKAPYSTPSFETAFLAEELDAWLSGEHLLSCRRLVVRLMRHTVALNSGSHCPQAWRHPLG